MGLDTLSAATGEESTTIEEAYEPYLIQMGFIARTNKGRIAMPRAYEHLGKKLEPNKEKQLKEFSKDKNSL